MAPKREDLAQRFDKRLKQAPARGAIVATQARTAARTAPAARPTRPTAQPARALPASRSRPSDAVATTRTTHRPSPAGIGRGSAGRKLRGHLVPRELHADARRRKLRLEAEQHRRFTWDEVATSALELLLAKTSQISGLLNEVRTIGEKSGVRRLVQATIPVSLDRSFSELRLDLSEKVGRDVSYEAMWSSALLLWVRER